MAAQRHSAQEHENINYFRRCKYSIELNGCFPSLEDEEIIKWGKSLIVFSLALVCSPFNFDRKIKEHCFHFQRYLSNVACIHSLLVQTQEFCTGILKDGASLGCDSIHFGRQNMTFDARFTMLSLLLIVKKSKN